MTASITAKTIAIVVVAAFAATGGSVAPVAMVCESLANTGDSNGFVVARTTARLGGCIFFIQLLDCLGFPSHPHLERFLQNLDR